MEHQIIFIFTYFVGNFIYNGETSRRVWEKKKKKTAFGGCSKGPSSFQRVSNMNKFHISVPIREQKVSLRSLFRDHRGGKEPTCQ